MCSTGLVIVENCFVFPESRNISIFRADHPFIIAILMGLDYSNILFVGRVVTL